MRLPSSRSAAGSEFRVSQAAIASKQARFPEVLLDRRRGYVREVQSVGRRGCDGAKKSATAGVVWTCLEIDEGKRSEEGSDKRYALAID